MLYLASGFAAVEDFMRKALLFALMLCLGLPSQAQKKHKAETSTPESERSAQKCAQLHGDVQ